MRTRGAVHLRGTGRDMIMRVITGLTGTLRSPDGGREEVRRIRRSPISHVIALPLVLLAAPLVGQTPGSELRDARRAPHVSATRVSEAPNESNWRDAAAWGQAEVVSDFIQSEPLQGAPASERTEVRVAYDDDAIYIGAWLYDSSPSLIVVGEQRRDANLARFDAFLVVLDTYQDRENGFVFATNPGGIEHDGQVINEGRGSGGSGRQQGGAQGGYNVNWDGSWTVVTERDDQGWYALFRIPFSTVRYGSNNKQQ